MFSQPYHTQVAQSEFKAVGTVNNSASEMKEKIWVATSTPPDSKLINFLQYMDNTMYDHESIRSYFTSYRNGCKRMLEERGVSVADVPTNPAIAALQIAVTSWSDIKHGVNYGRLDADSRELARWFHKYREEVIGLLEFYGQRKVAM